MVREIASPFPSERRRADPIPTCVVALFMAMREISQTKGRVRQASLRGACAEDGKSSLLFIAESKIQERLHVCAMEIDTPDIGRAMSPSLSVSLRVGPAL